MSAPDYTSLIWNPMDRPFTDDMSRDPMYLALTTESSEELHALWEEANRKIGKGHAPAENLPTLVYGYTQGRRDQLLRSALEGKEASR